MENNTKTIHRLYEYITRTGFSFNKLSIELGLSNSYFSKMLKNSGSIGSDIIENILRIHPDLDATWLLTGKGSMMHVEQLSSSRKDFLSLPIDESMYYKMYKEEKEEKEILIEKIGSLKERIRQLEADNNDGKNTAKGASLKKHSSQNADNATSANVHSKK